MAIVDCPLLSKSAHGTIAKQMQFRRHRGGVHVWLAPDPMKVNHRPASQAQGGVRSIYRRSWLEWCSLTVEQQQQLAVLAVLESVGLTGWNYYVQQSYPRPDLALQDELNLPIQTDVSQYLIVEQPRSVPDDALLTELGFPVFTESLGFVEVE